MRQITVNLYQFDELSGAAKEKAREWYREASAYDEWWESTYEDAERAGLKITSFDLDRHEIEGMFNDGACETAWKILEDHGEECETYKTAKAFLAARDKIVDEAPKDEDGEFEDECALDDALDEIEEEFLHDILEDYRIMLREELEYQMSDEQVEEAIRANEYEFNEDGSRA